MKNSSASSGSQGFASKLLLLLTALPLTLAFFAFILQWRGGVDDPAVRWPSDSEIFPGMEARNSGHSNPPEWSSHPGLSSSDCSDILGQRSRSSLSYYDALMSVADSEAHPKVRGL